MHIIFDRGHGIDTPGKRSKLWPNRKRLLEWNFNRRVLLEVRRWIDKNPTLCTYEFFPLDRMDVHVSERKQLYQEIAAEINDSVLLISVHGDAFDKSETAKGGTCFTSPGRTKSDDYEKFFKESFEYYKLPIRSSKEAKYTVLLGNNYYAVLLEMGFYTNFEECMFMLSKKGVNMYANVIIRGLTNILEL